jgi:S-formylglutathione hydrolase FrmB
MRSGLVPPIILIFPNGGVNSFYADSPDGSFPIETTIIGELIPHVDATYRTISTREGRAIAGFSMGGFGALALGMKHPELFSSILAYAPALLDLLPDSSGSVALARAGGTHPPVAPQQPALMQQNALTFQKMFGGEPELWARHSPWGLVPQVAGRLRATLPIRMIVGTADGVMNGNERLHDLLNSHGYYHDYFVVQGVAHNLRGLLDRVGLDGLRFQVRNGGWQ